MFVKMYNLIIQECTEMYSKNVHFCDTRMYTFDTQTCTLSHSKSVQLTQWKVYALKPNETAPLF